MNTNSVLRFLITIQILNVKKILAVINATYAVAKRKPEKIRLAGIRTLTSAIPVQRSNQLSYQANWELVIKLVRNEDNNVKLVRNFRNCISCVNNCEDLLYIYFFIPQFKYMSFIYSQFHIQIFLKILFCHSVTNVQVSSEP